MALNFQATHVKIPNLEIEIREHGVLVDVLQTHNIITTFGLRSYRNLGGYPSLPTVLTSDIVYGKTISTYAVGSGNSAPALANVALDNEIFRKDVTRRIAQGDDTIHYQLFLDTTEANGGGTQPLREVALFSDLVGGSCWTRAIHTLINKTSAISVTYNWRITEANG